ncbi:hypothetical protein LSH36_23g06050 [Paralvinella palmiformis]|uniref:Cyclin C-terminal domain-containing protein n=1 Tax=Paralvinella palmiformis TaxID=53620 RepID=A0AAD9NGX0_9ANNE|nr:hypothetical protein LSH36_23g06050 [Paralvinella palmiformis]
MRSSCFPKSACQSIKHVRLLCRYLLQVSLQYYPLCQFRPSLLAVAALHKADTFLNKDACYMDIDPRKYDAQEFGDCLAKFEPIVDRLLRNYDLEYIFRKFAHVYERREHAD